MNLPTKAGSAEPVYYDLDLPQITRWGPWLSSIRCHTKTTARSTNHQWMAVIEWSFDGMTWEDETDLWATPIAANGAAIQTAFSNTALFGLHIRIRLSASPSTGTAYENAVVSIVGEFTFKS